MQYYTMFAIIFFLYLHVQNIATQQDEAEACTTPSGKLGECINIINCKALMDILSKSRPGNWTITESVRNFHCGYEGTMPIVCCEKTQQQQEDLELKIASTQSSTTVKISETSKSTDPRNENSEESTVTKEPENALLPPDVMSHENLKLFDSETCGTITQRKIIGGKTTGVFDYPWMALLAYRTSQGKVEFRCGGTLINKRYILTAAHCLTALPSSLTLVGVRVGEHNLDTERDCDKSEDNDDSGAVCAERYQDLEIESIHHHRDFMNPRLQNDVGLIRLKQEADFRPQNVKPICLPFNISAPASKKVIVTGWGATESGESSRELLMVSLPPVANDVCAKIYERNAQISYKQMCAGGTSEEDSCIGDSGGPLQTPATFNYTVKFVQHGIVSFGLKNCGTRGFPGVYTRVAYYLDWILDTMTQ